MHICFPMGALSCVSGFPDVVGVGSAGSKAAGSLGGGEMRVIVLGEWE